MTNGSWLIDRDASYIAGMATLVLCMIATADRNALWGDPWPYARSAPFLALIYLEVELTAKSGSEERA